MPVRSREDDDGRLRSADLDRLRELRWFGAMPADRSDIRMLVTVRVVVGHTAGRGAPRDAYAERRAARVFGFGWCAGFAPALVHPPPPPPRVSPVRRHLGRGPLIRFPPSPPDLRSEISRTVTGEG